MVRHRFRWVVCQLDTLRRCFPASIRRALNELPMTLDETYERILLGIDREKREHAIRLLKCLAFSRRPLRVKELAEILAVQFDTTIPRLDTSLRPRDPDEAVLSACSTLVVITIGYNDYDYDHDHYPRLVQFSHYSVKEFLTSERLANSDKRDLSQYYISPEPAHTILAQSCISTLLQPGIHLEDITGGFPLARYAAKNWYHHAQCDGVASQIQDGMERLFDPDKKHFSMWISIHDMDNPGPWKFPAKTEPSPLYYAAFCGIRSLVEHLIITRQQDPNKSHGKWGTSLHVAVVSGHTTIVRLLLDHTANVNSRYLDNETLLCVAVRSGNFDIAQLLLNHGADVNALGRADSPLQEATRSQKLDAVEFLLKAGADANVRSIDNRTVLHEAAHGGKFGIVRLLLSHGADGNTVDRREDSPLHQAVRYQKLDVVELLLKSGVDVNVRNMDNWTPLHEAAGSGNFEIARLLLSHGADVHIIDGQGTSPLHHAARSHKPDGVELLLKSGADSDVNVRSIDNWTPLHETAYRGNFDIVRLLLSHGASVHIINDQGTSPLHHAVRSLKLDVVELLLQSGAEVNVRSIDNWTPLHEA